MRNTMIAKKSLVALGLSGALVAAPSLAYADETSDALVDTTLEIIDAPELSAALLEALTPLVEEAVELEVVAPEIVDQIEVSDGVDVSLVIEENLEEQKSIWEFSGETWSGAYADVAPLYIQCRAEGSDTDCLSVLGAEMALTVADSVTQPEFSVEASEKLEEKLGSRITHYYEKLDQRVAKAVAKLESLDPDDPNYSEKVAKTLENLDDKVAKLEARLIDKAEKLNEKAVKEAEKAEEKAVKEAEKAEEKAVKEAEKAEEKAVKEAEKAEKKANK
jgi:hypothetical protein